MGVSVFGVNYPTSETFLMKWVFLERESGKWVGIGNKTLLMAEGFNRRQLGERSEDMRGCRLSWQGNWGGKMTI